MGVGGVELAIITSSNTRRPKSDMKPVAIFVLNVNIIPQFTETNKSP